MKTFARMRVVAAASIKKVADVVVEVIDYVEPVGVPEFDKMDMAELHEMCREEGVVMGNRDESELRVDLEEAYELYPSDV